MHLDDYVRPVSEQLAAAAALADDRTREIAGRLADAAAPALRLAILSALGDAADEITAALLDSPGAPSVSVRMEAQDARIDVTAAAPEPAAVPDDAGEASARISLRLSETLKTEIDAAAAREGVSVNTWLVRVAGSALSSPWAGRGRPASRAEARINAHHVTGWING